MLKRPQFGHILTVISPVNLGNPRVFWREKTFRAEGNSSAVHLGRGTPIGPFRRIPFPVSRHIFSRNLLRE